MSPITGLWVIWGIITTGFVILWIYRSLIGMKEDDQLFLDPAEAHIEAEQKQIVQKIMRLNTYLKGLGFVSAALLILLFGLWTYPVLKDFFS